MDAFESMLDADVEEYRDWHFFTDGNHPGTIYWGTTAHERYLIEEGGAPIDLTFVILEEDGTVDCRGCGEGFVFPRLAPDWWLERLLDRADGQ